MAAATVPQRTPQIDTRQPTGRPTWPLLLVEGGEKTGKSWMAVQLATSDRFGRRFWIDWGDEGTGDEYGGFPGAQYQMVRHDGTFASVYRQVEEIYLHAKQQEEAGGAPPLLIIDSMTAEWEALRQEAHEIAVNSPSGRRKLEEDPGADVSISHNIWNKIHEWHGRLMRMLMTFPGVVVMTARGKEVTQFDEGGRPVTGSKTYKVEAHKNLLFDASVVIRLSRDEEPKVVGMRSLHYGLRPGKDDPKSLGDLTLEGLIWGVLFKNGAPQARELNPVKTRELTSVQTHPTERAPEPGTAEAAAAENAGPPDPAQPQRQREAERQQFVEKCRVKAAKHERDPGTLRQLRDWAIAPDKLGEDDPFIADELTTAIERAEWWRQLDSSTGMDQLAELYSRAEDAGMPDEFLASVQQAIDESQGSAEDTSEESEDTGTDWRTAVNLAADDEAGLDQLEAQAGQDPASLQLLLDALSAAGIEDGNRVNRLRYRWNKSTGQQEQSAGE